MEKEVNLKAPRNNSFRVDSARRLKGAVTREVGAFSNASQLPQIGRSVCKRND